MTPELGPRLAAVGRRVVPGAAAADIGTDHGYLPVWLVLTGRCPRVIASDRSPRVLEAAKATVERFGVGDLVCLRLGFGLEVLVPGEVETIVLAGMGGRTIVEILSGRPSTARAAGRLVLQPMRDAHLVRHWAVTNGFAIMDEDLVKERGGGGRSHIYEVISVEPSPHSGQVGEQEDPVYAEVGRLLIERRHPLLGEMVVRRIAELKEALRRLESSFGETEGEAGRRGSRMTELRERISRLQEVLRCLRG